MNKFKIALGATALAVAAVAIVACSKEKEQQQQTPAVQQTAEPHDYTLAEMAEAMSWEEGKAFFENQPVKDYTSVCEKVLNECGFAEKEAGLPYVISWVFRQPNEQCNVNVPGSCLVIRKKTLSRQLKTLKRFWSSSRSLGVILICFILFVFVCCIS